MKLFYFFMVLLVSTPNFTWAATEASVSGTITKISAQSTSQDPYDEAQPGILFLYLDGIPGACGDNTSNRIAISTEHPLYNTVLSIALSAQEQDKKVYLGYLDECTVYSHAWDFAFIRLIP